jgi:hypothetical protein
MTQPSTAQPAGSGAEAASAAPLPRQLEPRQLDPQQQQDQSGSTPPVALPFQGANSAGQSINQLLLPVRTASGLHAHKQPHGQVCAQAAACSR